MNWNDKEIAEFKIERTSESGVERWQEDIVRPVENAVMESTNILVTA